MRPEIIALIVATASAFGTGLAAFVYSVFEDVIKAKLNEWGLIKEDRKKLVDQIIAIAAEGQEKQYQQLPENERTIHIILNTLESMDSPLLKPFSIFYNNWITTATVGDRADSKEEKEFAKDMLKESESSRRKVLKALREWKK